MSDNDMEMATYPMVKILSFNSGNLSALAIDLYTLFYEHCNAKLIFCVAFKDITLSAWNKDIAMGIACLHRSNDNRFVLSGNFYDTMLYRIFNLLQIIDLL